MTTTTTITVKFRVPSETPFWEFAEAMQSVAKPLGGQATVVFQGNTTNAADATAEESQSHD